MESITTPLLVKQSRRFVFTWNNPTMNPTEFDKYIQTWQSVRYFLFSLQFGEKESTPHYQGYIEFSQKQREGTLAKRHKMWFKVARGNYMEATAYIRDSETNVVDTLKEWSNGLRPKDNKKQSLIAFRDNLKEQPKVYDVLENYPREMAIYSRFYTKCRSVYRQHYKDLKKEVVLCIGEPGTGKTTWARELSESYWINPIGTNNWFDEYEQQDVAILDDYGLDGTVYKLAHLLRLTHQWTEMVPIKGSFTFWNPKTVVITSNYHPLQWYSLNASLEGNRVSRWISYKALYRRFTKVMYFEKDMDPMECFDIPAFFLDTEYKFEHQLVPYEVMKEYKKDLLFTSEELEESSSTELMVLFDGIDLEIQDIDIYDGSYYNFDKHGQQPDPDNSSDISDSCEESGGNPSSHTMEKYLTKYGSVGE